MNTKITKSESKVLPTGRSRRISNENEKRIKKLLNLANNKKAGRKVKFDQLIQLALELVTEDHLKKLQDQTLKNEDRQELLRQKYISQRGPISKDEFIGFMMTAEYFEFLKSQNLKLNVAEAS